eukprot:Blabericola_migrator_1__2457@NODE_1691_length_3990_cov_26_202141_g1096_i0_p2_GENE_NODE_1691_length_3990_cov_26_202141_g1096_i0NODE_1691_length_3990_cov_26_202141_g1096_i0_p2_ORF_typecomplete_len235_score35_31_NODE_1691_length_3990_cov_26_202141_g1096_i015732277
MFDDLRRIRRGFWEVCITSDASRLAESLWAACVLKTRHLWSTYGQAFKSLLLSPDQLGECSKALANLMIEDRPRSPSEGGKIDVSTWPRHPWDTLLIKVMLHVISEWDVRPKGVAKLLDRKNEVLKTRGLSQEQAKEKVEALEAALFKLDLVSARPHSLCAELLPQLKLEREEEEKLKSVPEALHSDPDSVTEDPGVYVTIDAPKENVETPETQTDTSPPSAPLPDCTWHWASE